MRTLIRLIAFILALVPLVAFSQEPPPTIEILSKDDARMMFAMSEDQWLANVQRAVETGAATPMETRENGIGMAMNTPDGDLLMVSATYAESKKKPDFIQVSVGYRYPKAALLPDSVLKGAVEAAQAQMEPEYEVIGSVERIEGGVSLFFVIMEKNP